jgi:hypothetical protein
LENQYNSATTSSTIQEEWRKKPGLPPYTKTKKKPKSRNNILNKNPTTKEEKLSVSEADSISLSSF